MLRRNVCLACAWPNSAAGNWARAFRVAGGNINQYITADAMAYPSCNCDPSLTSHDGLGSGEQCSEA